MSYFINLDYLLNAYLEEGFTRAGALEEIRYNVTAQVESDGLPDTFENRVSALNTIADSVRLYGVDMGGGL